VAKVLRLRLKIIKRSDDIKGFVVLPRRWEVERTFSWFRRNRRLAKDYAARQGVGRDAGRYGGVGPDFRRPAGFGSVSRPLPESPAMTQMRRKQPFSSRRI
jgi:Transposase DDE domain